MADLKKLGMDRGTTSTATSVKPVTNRASVGDITAGKIVSVRIGRAAATSQDGQAKVPARSTAAFLTSNTTNQRCDWWYISGDVLTVRMAVAINGTVDFWVF